MPGFLKCTCEHCGGRIEYPAEAVGANVPCPHCQQETPLKLDGGGDADVVTVGGGKAKLVIGVVVASLVAVGVLVAALLWAKKKGAGKDAPVAAASGKANTSAAAAPSNPLAKVELDPPKSVVPEIGKFQNGLTATQIKGGREVIGGACTDCHRQFDPATYREEEWNRIVGTMRGKAKLNAKQSEALDTFVRSVRN